MGGDHKCPLCSATFTRPQHVGRHLRAHTGDRPYECKECPLRFARSDLLSRHVNKAHKAPDGPAPEKKLKPKKKGRRQSLPASSLSATKQVSVDSSTDTFPTQPSTQPPAQAQPHAQAHAQAAPPQPPHTVRERSRSASMMQQHQLQAHSMYPDHPLLANAGSSHTPHVPGHTQHPYPPHPQPQSQHAQSWNVNPSQAFATTAGMVNHHNHHDHHNNHNNHMSPPFNPVIVNPMTGAAMGSTRGFGEGLGGGTSMGGQFPPPLTYDPPFTAQPMLVSGSDSEMDGTYAQGPYGGGTDGSQGLQVTYEWGFKKRACDQCNQSKVKCDSAEPCLRCTHRNISCTYVKPQRARTMGNYPMVSSHAPPPYALDPTPTNPLSDSPQPHFSSSHPINSPIAPTEPLIYRQPSVASLPVNLGMGSTSGGGTSTDSTATAPGQGMRWNAYPQATWPPMPSMGSLPAGTAPGSITGQVLESPGTLTIPLQSFPGLQPPHSTHGGHAGTQGQSQRSSPRNLMPTPSLTSNTTSPSDLDEPAERRGSRGSYHSAGGSNIGGQARDKGKQVEGHGGGGGGGCGGPQLPTLTLPFNHVLPSQISPTQASPAQQVYFVNPFQPNSSYLWPQAAGRGGAGSAGDTNATANAGWQVRKSFSSDDDAASVMSSSANSTMFEINDAQMEDRQRGDRRPSSQGRWANALGQLSLQDAQKCGAAAAAAAAGVPGVPGAPGGAMTLQEPFGGNSQRRTTYPILGGVRECAGETQGGMGMVGDGGFDAAQGSASESVSMSMSAQAQAQGLSTVLGQGLGSANLSRDGTLSGDESGSVPSLSGVKDLWRLYMAEPMCGLTPAGEKPNGMDDISVMTTVNSHTNTHTPLVTPRPAIGKSTLSKSSSMPDLHSPMVGGPAFFSTFLAGTTPRPGDPQVSYIPQNQPHGGAAGGAGAGGEGGEGGADREGEAGGGADVAQGDMGKWSKEIQQRGSSFSLSGNPGGKLGNGMLLHLPNPQQSMEGGMMPPGMQPAPSGGQHSSALDQTLAPERVPSSGGMPGAEGPQGASTSSSDQSTQHPAQSPHVHTPGLAHGLAANPQIAKLVSADARPGAKRAANHTLTSEAGKKASFTLWGEEAEAGQARARARARVGAGSGMDGGVYGGGGAGQGQEMQQGQLASMFYPDWTLNAETTAS